MNDKIKALFPKGVETITISKNDYDRLYGELTYQNIQLQSNWNSLREYYKRKAEEAKDSTALYDKWTKYSSVLDKMNELEGKK